mmetsp:Transcript_81452/g.263832  ORF Transcript_81452/g.263832 Transcript_81452/m.263832 type:complete len:283 (-) Transcript_81452:111-959(-)
MTSPLASAPLANKAGARVPADALTGKVVALYFSAHWCPPCRGFTPALRQFYDTLKSSGEPLEIVFVSGDRSKEEFQEYFANDHGDWLAVDFDAKEKQALSQHYGIKGIPALIVVDSKGKVVVPEARQDVARSQGPAGAKAVFAEWKKAAGDWRETAGTALGGGSGSAPMDAAAMRAARLARLGGGGTLGPAAALAPAAEAATLAAATTPAPAVAPAPATATSAPAAMPPPEAAVQPAVAAGGLDEAAVAQLIAMGFPEANVRQALEATSGNVESATDILVSS